MAEDKQFSGLLEQFDSAVVALKKARKIFEEEVSGIEKRKQDAETSLRYAKIGYEEQLGKNTAYLKEFEEKKSTEVRELEKQRAVAIQKTSEADALFKKAEETLKSAEQKEVIASARLTEAEKLKSEYSDKVEKARAMAQALG